MIATETKIQVIESELRSLERQEYQYELQCKAFKATGQEDMLEHRTELLVQTKAKIDFYNQEMEKLKPKKDEDK